MLRDHTSGQLVIVARNSQRPVQVFLRVACRRFAGVWRVFFLVAVALGTLQLYNLRVPEIHCPEMYATDAVVELASEKAAPRNLK